jgi:ferric-dicitrate binding protein FerR (iron transport regulator)
MSAVDCRRWMAARDRELIDEPVSAAERELCAQHEASCPECGREAKAFGGLQLQLRGELELSAGYGSPSERASSTLSRRRLQPRWFRKPALAMAAVVCVAAAAALALHGLRSAPGDASATNAAVVAQGALFEGAGRLGVGARVEPGAHLATKASSACVRVPDDVLLCLYPHTELVLSQLSGASRSVKLERGRVVAALGPQERGASFAIATDSARVTALGTVFSVEQASANVIVRVHEGSVEAFYRSGGTEKVEAGEELRLDRSSRAPLNTQQRQHDLELVREHPRAQALTTASAEVAVGETPVSAPTPSVLEPPAPVAVPATEEGPGDRLARARALKARGDARGAAEQYRALQRSHPTSREALASYVSLAELELRQLGEPAAALRHYELYLGQGGGALREEASIGRIRALQALGREQDALRHSQDFLKRYPKSPHAEALQRGLQR